ncbi:hypothetical protein PTI98_011898 [Pleurotus ostreatus]|nr:hypothetical protein PTI98_011898 [Pleurotus ostreatus]
MNRPEGNYFVRNLLSVSISFFGKSPSFLLSANGSPNLFQTFHPPVPTHMSSIGDFTDEVGQTLTEELEKDLSLTSFHDLRP